jgi:hypothetical protein
LARLDQTIRLMMKIERPKTANSMSKTKAKLNDARIHEVHLDAVIEMERNHEEGEINAQNAKSQS